MSLLPLRQQLVHSVPDVADVRVREAVADEQERVPEQVGPQALIDGSVEVHAREEVALAQDHRLLAAQGPVELDDLASVLWPRQQEVAERGQDLAWLARVSKRALNVAVEVRGVDRPPRPCSERTVGQ